MRWRGSCKGLLFFALVWGLLTTWPSAARAESYKYTDKNGVVHFTDDPYALPEPQRSKVLRRLEQERAEQEKRRQQGLEKPPQVREKLPVGHIGANPKGGKGRADPPKTGRTTTDPTSASQREQWKTKMANARKRVNSLREECDKLRTTRNDNKRKSLIFATPGARAEANKAADSLTTCEQHLKEAKHKLEVDLPEEARRAGVPPGWLRD